MNARHIFVVFFSLFCCQSAAAQNFSTPFGPGSTAQVSLTGGQAYTCIVSDSGNYTLSLNVMGPSGETITAVYPAANQAFLDGSLTGSKNFGDANLSDNVISFLTTAGSAGFGEYTITMANAAAMSTNPFVFCQPLGSACNFNTFLNDAAYLEVTNLGTKSVPLVYRTVDFDGATTENSITIPSGRRIDLDIHSLVGRSKFGSVIVLPRNSPFLGEFIRARLSQYTGDRLRQTEICSSLFGIGNV